jgi:hypothetical protein
MIISNLIVTYKLKLIILMFNVALKLTRAYVLRMSITVFFVFMSA